MMMAQLAISFGLVGDYERLRICLRAAAPIKMLHFILVLGPKLRPLHDQPQDAKVSFLSCSFTI
jgi:hypothetical protein